jgi:DotD protein
MKSKNKVIPYISRVLLVSSLVGFLSACAQKPLTPTETDLDQADVAINDLLKKPLTPVGPETKAPSAKFGALNTVSYLGDASILLTNTAKGMGEGWKFQSLGATPHLPIYIQINVKGASFSDYLTQVALQLGQRADIEVDGKTIKLVHRDNR